MQKRWTINQGKTNLHNKWKIIIIIIINLNEYEEALKIKKEVHNDAKIRRKQRKNECNKNGIQTRKIERRI